MLLTNLANRVQPIIRYDLGDRVLVRPEPCTCGNPLPAIRVQGRCGDVVRLRAASGRLVELLPLAIETAIEEAGVDMFQVAQVGPHSLRVRLPGSPDGPPGRATERGALAALATLLRRHGVEDADLALDAQPPAPLLPSGKRKTIVVEC